MNLKTLIECAHPLIWVCTSEEERLISSVLDTATHLPNPLDVFCWDAVNGVRLVGLAPSGSLYYGTSEVPGPDPAEAILWLGSRERSTILLLLDVHKFMAVDPRSLRAVRNSLFLRTENVDFITIVVAPTADIPTELKRQVAIIDLPLPTVPEIREFLVSNLGDIDPQLLERSVQASRGLSFYEIESAVARSHVEHGDINPDSIMMEKKHIIRESKTLEFFDTEETLADVGGLTVLMEWLDRRKVAFSPEAKKFGLPLPRGFLMVGVPGSGKSLTSKGIARSWGIPLLRFDIGSAFQSLLGETESAGRDAQRTATAIAPCVFWMDEIDKGLGGMEGSKSDGGTGSRLLSSMMTWMQEKKEPVVIVATCNSVHSLPGALLRKGRFDEIFFVDLPDIQDLEKILEIQIRKVGRNPSNFNIKELSSKYAYGLVGAEIKSAVEEALFLAYHSGKDLEQEHLMQALLDVIPYSVTKAEEVEELRKWAKDRARPAQSGTVELSRVQDLRKSLRQPFRPESSLTSGVNPVRTRLRRLPGS